jgi:serine protease
MTENYSEGLSNEVERKMSAALLSGSPGYPPARFALELHSGQRSGEVIEAAQQYLSAFDMRISPLSDLDQDVLVVEFPRHRLENIDPAAAFTAGRALETALNVETAEPDLPTAFFPDYTLQHERPGPAVDEGLTDFTPWCWAPEEPDLNNQPRWALESMRVPAAWEFSRLENRPSQGSGIVIAQPDTGIVDHAELRGVQKVAGFDFIASDSDPTDPLNGANAGHGTGTASVLVSPPTLQVTGSAPSSLFMALRAIESVVLITQVTVARAIDWAVNHGASVITMSLGGLPSFTLLRALQRAVAADVIVLAAAGNCVGTVVWPARYDECIAVAGTNRADGQWRGSCRGAAVDISAPAQNVIRAWQPSGAATGGNRVGQAQGTSYAVALAAGVAALWLAHHGRANLIAEARKRQEPLQMMFRRLLQATARRPRGWDSLEMGAGIVDAAALLKADFDLGLDREDATRHMDMVDSEAKSMMSFIAETVGINAVDDELIDWHRFGPEIASALLSTRRSAELQDPGEESLDLPTISEDLAGAINNVQLRERLTNGGVPMADSVQVATPR